MSIEYDFKFLSDYWQYICAGIVCYISARFFHAYLGNKYRNVYKIVEERNNYKTPDEEILQLTEAEINDAENDEGYNDMGINPALPRDLKHVPLAHEKFSLNETIERSTEFYRFMNLRRTVRHFSSESVPIEVIRNIVKTAGTAPSGAHTEPWTYVVIHDPDIKGRVREIIEQEEEINYCKRMGKKWTTDLKPLRTDWVKQYLTEAPYLILVFKQMYSYTPDGQKRIHYYNEQSINIAVGMLITAIHYAGLVALTSTPLNCGPALRALLNRPSQEKLILLLPVGYPAEDCLVPDLSRKPLDEILVEV